LFFLFFGIDRRGLLHFFSLSHKPTDAIKDLDPSRKCFRLIGGVLVERTVAEVLPAVQKNQAGLAAVIGTITDQRDSKMRMVDELQKKYKIRVKGEPEAEDEDDTESGKQGVLA
jgi:prefoldin subunit 2